MEQNAHGELPVSLNALRRPAETVADLLHWCGRLGGLPPSRILIHPEPGAATVDDLFHAERADRRCELVDGTLVAKPMGRKKSVLAGILIGLLNNWALPRRLGEVSGEQGGFRLAADLVRTPDIAFTSRERLSRLPQPEPAYPKSRRIWQLKSSRPATRTPRCAGK